MREQEDGYVLAVVLVFAAALMVLLAAFGPLSVANMNQAVRQERKPRPITWPVPGPRPCLRRSLIIPAWLRICCSRVTPAAGSWARATSP